MAGLIFMNMGIEYMICFTLGLVEVQDSPLSIHNTNHGYKSADGRRGTRQGAGHGVGGGVGSCGAAVVAGHIA